VRFSCKKVSKCPSKSSQGGKKRYKGRAPKRPRLQNMTFGGIDVFLENQPPACTGSSFSRCRPSILMATPLREQSLDRCCFFLMQKTQHRVGDCSRRGFATQIEARGPENRLPVQAARRFRKSTRSGTLSRNGCPTDPRKRPRVRQTISKETQNQPKVLSRVTLEARWTPSFPETPQRPSHETILSLKMSSGTILPPIWNMF